MDVLPGSYLSIPSKKSIPTPYFQSTISAETCAPPSKIKHVKIQTIKGDPVPEKQLLGHVKVASGRVLLIDMGLLNLWCHDRPPSIPEGALSDELRAASLTSRDFVIEGPDAAKTAKALERQSHSEYLYDIPAESVDDLKSAFHKTIAQNHFKSTLRMIDQRIPHLLRIEQTLADATSGALFFSGISAIVAKNIPSDTTLNVYGIKCDDPQYFDRWQQVFLQVREDAPVFETRLAGKVTVDQARLMFVDPDALAHWQHETPIDGKADFVFWGKDARDAATTFNAGHLPDDGYGWMNQPVQQVIEMGLAVQEYRKNANLKFAIDFRPHSHHYELMKQIRTSETESGTMHLGSTDTCAFMTTWGDGFFSVYEDIDQRGSLLRIRVQLEDPENIQRLQSMVY
jgi:hypothetical protein